MQKKNKKKSSKFFVAFIVIGIFCFWVIKDFMSGMYFPKEGYNKKAAGAVIKMDDWNLILVNRWNSIPKGYTIKLTELSNGKKVDSRIYPYLQEMFDSARQEGIYPFVREGYRTKEEQQQLYDEKVEAYMQEGYSRNKSEKLAMEWVALPDTSEHQLGIAVDINAVNEKSTNEEVYEWLAHNAHKYGFILRYPQGKEEVTGTSYEPWHYRYVGKFDAQKIFEQGISLEEYCQSKMNES